MDLAEQIAKHTLIALRLARLQLYGGLRLDLDTVLDMIAVFQGIAASTDDHKEAVAAFREKRTSEYRAS